MCQVHHSHATENAVKHSAVRVGEMFGTGHDVMADMAREAFFDTLKVFGLILFVRDNVAALIVLFGIITAMVALKWAKRGMDRVARKASEHDGYCPVCWAQFEREMHAMVVAHETHAIDGTDAEIAELKQDLGLAK